MSRDLFAGHGCGGCFSFAGAASQTTVDILNPERYILIILLELNRRTIRSVFTKTSRHMIIDHSSGLHIGIHNR